MRAIIRHPKYRFAVLRLKRDARVQAMAASIPPEVAATHDDGTPTFQMMLTCNEEYLRRGGKALAHVGAVAEAVLEILREKIQ